MSSGLTVSRLGVQASVVDETVHGLICLRISLPRENESNHALRWNLFSSKPPKLISEPSILPLPLPVTLRSSSTPRTSRPRALAIASTLLGLPPPSTYPPNRYPQSPYLDVSSNSGQVSVVLEQGGKGKHRTSSGPSGPSGGVSGIGGKMDWIVIMEFEKPVEQGSERGFTKVMLSLPKCLHSIIRFQITPPTVGPSSISSSGEVSIMTEPKMLALPASTFGSPAIPYPRTRDGQVGIGYEDGWEDGEDMRDGQASEGESEDDDPASWLEGRFQATSQLRLEWAFASAYQATTLQVIPRWDARHPAINITYETNPPTTSDDQLVPIEIIIPDGWGWRDLEITGPNLVSWRSTDTDYFDVHLRDRDHEEEEEGPDDSFSTIKNLRPQPPPLRPQLRTHTSASLMKQTLPVSGDMTVDDFSFEMTSGDHLTIPASTSTGSGNSRPGTPARASPGPTYLQNRDRNQNQSQNENETMDQPVAARYFDLVFGNDPRNGADSDRDRGYMIEGTLVPLSTLTLVSGSIPVEIPFIRSPTQIQGSGECTIICPNGLLSSGVTDEGVCDTTQPSIGTFTWVDAYGSSIRPLPQEPVRGNIRVRVHRGKWGSVGMSILFPWPRGQELAFHLAGDEDEDQAMKMKMKVKVIKADVGGVGVPRSLTRVGGGYEVRLGSGQDGRAGQGGLGRVGKMTEVVLEFEDLEDIPLPHFADADGQLTVELRGDGWSSVMDQIKIPLALTRSTAASSPYTFTTTLPTPEPLHLSIHPHPHPQDLIAPKRKSQSQSRIRGRTLFSLNTFFNLFVLWLVVSLGQQVQRLRSEISFVAEEARDLRMYGFDQRHQDQGQHQQQQHQHTQQGQGQGSMVTTATESTDGGGVIPTILPDGTDLRILLEHLRREDANTNKKEVGRGVESSLGRVVFGRSAWEGWTNNPAVKTIGKGVTRIWEVVAWLIGVA